MNALQLEELHYKLQKLKLERINDEEDTPKKKTTPTANPTTNASDLFANLHVGSYHTYATLGTGTFGKVRQVVLKQDPSRTVYALKVMKKCDVIRLKQVEHIRSEKAILLDVRHPFIVQLMGTFQDDKCVYMLFEYVCGGELFSRLRKDGRFSKDIVVFYAAEILLAIQHLHRRHIVYRDLKPENLLIAKDGHIKIADFGFAKLLDNNRTFTLCGTPEYLAPELIKGAKLGYGRSIDWWALGVLIFEMLVGHPPFYDIDPTNIYKKIIQGVIDMPRFLHVRSKDVIIKLLNPDATRRMGVADDGVSIMQHKFFRGVPWQKVHDKLIDAPWVPYVKNEADNQWFDHYDEVYEDIPDVDQQHLFEGF